MLLVRQAQQDLQVILVLQDLQVQLVRHLLSQDLQVLQATLDPRGTQVLPDPPDLQEQPARL